ncbi:hypothetical protein UFOVP376_28 [uncultured Caudovirales phage]|uniref:Uncharacterized protein n=1 Tax=uncultured Caudovirales phage TaxID=2100421 RepID=A0A6J7X164_9CAUD|nr:hypothetical protein UFOVP376_28 [uncultured Caudovirales phage]
MKRPLESDYTSQAAYTRALEMYCEDYGEALPIAYQSGYYDGKKQRPWVGLTEEDFSAINQSCFTKLQSAASAESILKEKNNG